MSALIDLIYSGSNAVADLTEQLTATDAVAVATADQTAAAELNDTEKQGQAPEPGDVVPVAFTMEEDEVDGLSEGEEQGERPKIEAKDVEFGDGGIGFWEPGLQQQGEEEGKGEGGAYFAEHQQEAGEEATFGMIADEGEDNRRHDGDHQVAHNGVGSHRFAVGTEEAADYCHRGGHRAKHTDKYTFGHDIVAAEQFD